MPRRKSILLDALKKSETPIIGKSEVRAAAQVSVQVPTSVTVGSGMTGKQISWSDIFGAPPYPAPDGNPNHFLNGAGSWVVPPGATPSGTGFVHVTAGVEDSSAKLVSNADVSATAGIVESKLSLNYATHPSVTLDANAQTLLTLSTQQIGLATQSANKVNAGPTTGPDSVPAFRLLVAADIPALPYAPSALTSGHLFVGNVSNIATDVAMSGDATISNIGALTISNSAVTLSKMADMATASLIYRKSAGSGVPEVNSLATLKTDLGTMPPSAHTLLSHSDAPADGTGWLHKINGGAWAISTPTYSDVGADAAGAAATVQGNLTTHIGLTGTSVHGLGTMSTQNASAVAITGGTLAGLTGFAIRDTSAAFDVTFAAVSSVVLTAARTITFDSANVSKTLKLAGNLTVSADATVSGTNTGDQTLAGLGGVPTTRTVNGKALSSDIILGLASADFVNQGTATTVLHGNAAGNPAFGSVVEADLGLTDLATANVSTSAHGLAPKAVAPASGTLNYLGINNTETASSWKSASSNPGAVARILQSDTSGSITLVNIFATGTILVGTASSSGTGSVDATGDIQSQQSTGAKISLYHNNATGNFTLQLVPANLTATHIVTFGNVAGTVALGAGSITSTSTDDVTVANHTHAVDSTIVTSARTISVSGLGLSGGGDLSANRTITLASSSNPGTSAASILSSDASGNLTIAGILAASGTTDSTSSSTGALQSAGGLGVAKSVVIGGGLSIGGDASISHATSADLLVQSTNTTTYSRMRLLAKNSGNTTSDWRIVNDGSGSSSVLTIYGGDGASLATRMTISATGVINYASPPSFVTGDKYLVIDSSGNIHKSAIGPAS